MNPAAKGWQIQPHYGGGDGCGYVYCKWALLFWDGVRVGHIFESGGHVRAYMKLNPNGPPPVGVL